MVNAVETLTMQIADPGARAQVLGRLAAVAARRGDRDQATRLADETACLANAAAAFLTQSAAEAFMTQSTDLVEQGIAV